MTTAPPAIPGTRRSAAGARQPAVELPVARVAVEVPLAHLDRPFDYLVDERDSAAATPGVRVRIRFAGRLVGGYLLARLAGSEHHGRLGYVERVVSPEPVLTTEIADLARAVADRYAGTLADVLRLAVPPRHAKAEASLASPAVLSPRADLSVHPAPLDARASTTVQGAATPSATSLPTRTHPAATSSTAAAAVDRSAPPGEPRPSPEDAVQKGPAAPEIDGWARYPAGPAFLAAIRDRRPARAVWQALPGADWPARLADAAAVAAGAGRGALLIVPDARDLHRLDLALTAALGGHPHSTLAADLGPAERYRRFLTIRRGDVRIVAGTRAAVFAPVADLALVAIFDDGDDLLSEPRAPYPHAREVLMMRSAAGPCALLVGGFARTAEAQLLLDSGWAHPISPDRAEVRSAAPRIEAAGDDFAAGATSAAAHARLSPAAFAAARAAIDAGAPVLVQVPRGGYLPIVACARCRRQALCRRCHGPLAQTAGGGPPSCRWCGVPEAHFRCAACGFGGIRAMAVGSARTAEEFGRAFPGVTVLSSAGSKVRATVPPRPAVIVATPGAEPVVDGGYGAALLLDGSAMLARPDLRAAEETLRRWMAAAALVRPAGDGGRVVVGADGSLPTVQALVRWDPGGHATRELAARRELEFPPSVAMASIEGDETAVLAALDILAVPPDGELLGPVDVAEPGRQTARPGSPTETQTEPEPRLRALVRAPLAQRRALCAALQAVAASRSARKEPGSVRIRVDPSDLF